MPFIVIIIAAIILVVAFNNSQGDLVKALESDIPGYFKWAAAIAVILGLGYVPGLSTISRWIMALVALIVLLTQYQAIFSGFTGFATQGSSSTGQGSATPSPTQAYATGNTTAIPTAQQIAGSSSSMSPGFNFGQMPSVPTSGIGSFLTGGSQTATAASAASGGGAASASPAPGAGQGNPVDPSYQGLVSLTPGGPVGAMPMGSHGMNLIAGFSPSIGFGGVA